jgi:hypothetical protein
MVAGDVGIAWSVGGRARVAWALTVRDGRIAHIEMVADRDDLTAREVTEVA